MYKSTVGTDLLISVGDQSLEICDNKQYHSKSQGRFIAIGTRYTYRYRMKIHKILTEFNC